MVEFRRYFRSWGGTIGPSMFKRAKRCYEECQMASGAQSDTIYGKISLIKVTYPQISGPLRSESKKSQISATPP